MNMVQFQAGLSMSDFMKRYGTEAKCRRTLFRSRWPKGFRCPACSACRYQTTLVCGTLFQATKLPLATWFLAVYLLTSTKTNMAALELKRHLGVCYRTAWRLKHKVMQAMMKREESRQLKGFVQIDDAYLGGERNGGKRGRAATEARGARWVNIVLANVKRSIGGSYHAFKQAKYARRYLGEAAYRFNRRFRLPELAPRLLHAMIVCKPCPERLLRQASNFSG